MLNIKKLLSKILQTDLVIESGTDSSGWAYKKYASGLFEAERTWNVGQVTINTVEGSPIRVGATINIGKPSAMTSGSVSATLMGNSSNSAIFLEHISNTQVRIAKVISSNVTLQNVTLALRTVNGKWK